MKTNQNGVSTATRSMVQIALIGALYTALTLISGPLAFGPVQFRLSEALTLLPLFSPIAVWGVTFGCFISNILGFFMGTNVLGLLDAPIGTIATLLAAFLTYLIGRLPALEGRLYTVKCLLASLPPILLNALIVGAELTYVFNDPPTAAAFWGNALSVGVGEAVVCWVLGTIMCLVLKRGDLYKRIFPEQKTA